MSGLRTTTVLALQILHLLLRREAPLSPADLRRLSGWAPAPLNQILKKLREAGLIERRAGGGYLLARAPGEIRMVDIRRAVDSPRAPAAPCDGEYDACRTRATCILAPLCRKAQAAFQESLEEFTLADLADVQVDIPNCLDPNLRHRAS